MKTIKTSNYIKKSDIDFERKVQEEKDKIEEKEEGFRFKRMMEISIIEDKIKQLYGRMKEKFLDPATRCRIEAEINRLYNRIRKIKDKSYNIPPAKKDNPYRL